VDAVCLPGGWRKSLNEEFHNLVRVSKYYYDNQIKEDEMCWACSTRGGM
jgi:hypothetical protein